MLNNSNLYNSEWLALVFSNRNKNYGAYVLRSQSSAILLKALAIVAPVFIMLFVGPMIYAQFHKTPPIVTLYEHPQEIAPDPIHEIEPKKELPKNEEQPKPQPALEKVNTVNLTSNIHLVENPVVEPPTTLQVQEAVVGSITQSGESGAINNVPVIDNKGGGGGTGTETVDPNAVYDQYGVDAFPEFPGGMEAWAKFIRKNLNYPYAAQEAGVQGKVFISFVVERDGSITDVKVAKGIGFGCDDEAIRVIKKSPRWKPGMQNKQSVRVRYNMPINYMLSL